jgi:hypothetical protein
VSSLNKQHQAVAGIALYVYFLRIGDLTFFLPAVSGFYERKSGRLLLNIPSLTAKVSCLAPSSWLWFKINCKCRAEFHAAN